MAGADVLLTRDVRLSDAPCWELAAPEDAAKLQATAVNVIQPLVNQFGSVVITSWKRWRDGCELRSGAHQEGGTVDLVVPNRTREAWEWGNTHLMPAGYIGRWIYEPATPTQGPHIHASPRADMIAYNGDGRIQSLKKLPDGSYFVVLDWEGGTFQNPYEMEPLVVTARAGIPWWVSLALLFSIFTLDMAGQSQGGWRFRTETAD